jgi:replicative DNA helicase
LVNHELLNEEAERCLIGAALLASSTLDNVAIRPDHFGNIVWRACWETMQAVHASGKPLDPLVLTAELEKRGAPENIIIRLSEAMGAVPTAANADHYADLVRDAWLRREIAVLSGEMVVPGRSGAEMVGLLETRVTQLMTTSGSKLPTLDLVIADELRQLSEPVPAGLPTGVGLEAVVPGGIPTDRVTTIFGESGSFKSTVKNAVVHAIASAGHVVVDCSFEDSNSLTAARWISRDTGVAYGALASRTIGMVNPNLPSLAAAGRVIAAGDMAPTVAEVLRVARQYKRLANAKAIVVDYLQLLESGKLGQRETLDEAMRSFQILAKREQIAVICVSQVKQDIGTNYERKNPRPTIYDPIGSSSIRTATKLGVAVFRPFNHCKAPIDDEGPYGIYARLREAWPTGPVDFDAKVYPELLELIVAKQVAGVAPSVVYARVNPATGVVTPFNMERYV